MLFTNKIYRPVAFFFIIIKFISQETSSIVTHFILFFFYFKPCSFRNRSLNLFYINPFQKKKQELKKKVKYKDDQCKIRLIYNNTLF